MNHRREGRKQTPGLAEGTPIRIADSDTATGRDVIRDGFILDFISGSKEVKETPKELVRQRIARALFHEYGISVEDMAADFPVRVGGRRRRVDVAIFAAGVLETITVNGHKVTRTLRRKKRIPDNDLPEIAKRYRAFRREHPEPQA